MMSLTLAGEDTKPSCHHHWTRRLGVYLISYQLDVDEKFCYLHIPSSLDYQVINTVQVIGIVTVDEGWPFA